MSSPETHCWSIVCVFVSWIPASHMGFAKPAFNNHNRCTARKSLLKSLQIILLVKSKVLPENRNVFSLFEIIFRMYEWLFLLLLFHISLCNATCYACCAQISPNSFHCKRESWAESSWNVHLDLQSFLNVSSD